MPRRLFISHSSKTDEHLQFLRELCAELDDAASGYTLVYDRNGDIKGGDDWYNRIDRWMAECHAAVILFSKAAVYESDWVKKEAAILAWRAELQPDFVLIPVLLDELEPDALKNDLLGILKIAGRGQCLRGCADATRLADSIRQKLSSEARLERCCSLNPDEPSFEPLEGKVVKLLVKFSSDDLEEIVDDLDLQRPSWPPDNHKQNALAVARYLFSGAADSLTHLRAVVNALPEPPTRERCRSLFRYLGAMWVDPLAARSIPAARTIQSTVAMNGLRVSEYTAERYVERAWPFLKNRLIVNVKPESRTIRAIQDDIEDRFAANRSLSSDERARRVNAQREPVITVLPSVCLESRNTQERLLDRLRIRYPRVIFIVDAGQSYEWLPDDIPSLLPELDADIETQQMQNFDDTKRYISDLYGGG